MDFYFVIGAGLGGYHGNKFEFLSVIFFEYETFFKILQKS